MSGSYSFNDEKYSFCLRFIQCLKRGIYRSAGEDILGIIPAEVRDKDPPEDGVSHINRVVALFSLQDFGL